MTFRVATLATVIAIATAPAMAATHHASTSSADNSADQLNATSLSDTQSGKAYEPTHMAESSPMTRHMKSRHTSAVRAQTGAASGASEGKSAAQGQELKDNNAIQENSGTQVQPAPK